MIDPLYLWVISLLSTSAATMATPTAFLHPCDEARVVMGSGGDRGTSRGPAPLTSLICRSMATVLATMVAFVDAIPRARQPEDRGGPHEPAHHIGGAVNYVTVAEALQVSPSALAAGLAADNVICVFYFTMFFALAAKIPAEEVLHSKGDNANGEPAPAAGAIGGDGLPVLESATVMAVSFAICKAGKHATALLSIQGGSLPYITAIVFFAVVGANGSIRNVVHTTPGIFVFAFVQIVVHLLVIMCAGRLLGMEKKLLLIASNANVGGPTTACGIILGIVIATFLGIAFDMFVLKHM
ncbi:hypothetical protein VPH35_000698 [Triticum aestivum]